MDQTTPEHPADDRDQAGEAADDATGETAEESTEKTAGRTAESDWERNRRLAAVFGDVLPDTTSDEQDTESPEQRDDAADRWLRSQVPPHHG
jgi:hypothetical protein